MSQVVNMIEEVHPYGLKELSGTVAQMWIKVSSGLIRSPCLATS